MGQTPSSREVQTSELYAKHLQDLNRMVPVNSAFATSVKFVLQILANNFDDASNLREKLEVVCQRANDGAISSVRRAEIEMLAAGKVRIHWLYTSTPVLLTYGQDCMPAFRFFDSYTPEVRGVCDQIYKQHDAGTSRRDTYHRAGIALIEKLIPELDGPSGNPLLEEHDDLDELEEFFDRLTKQCGTGTPLPFPLDFISPTGECVTTNSTQHPTPAVLTSPTENTAPGTETHKRQEASTSEALEQQGQKAEADSSCEICGYRPKGDPQWFKGSMAKHKKLQHSKAPPVIYKCPYPGCTSQYKNRYDNLQQHQNEKNHWVGEEDTSTPRRPSKRKKVGADQ